VQVHWPGGKVTRSEVPALANSIVVDASGAVRAGK